MSKATLIIGSRGSRLALEQARRVRSRLTVPTEVRIIQTSGDRFAQKPIQEQEGVGFFTKEIEQELLAGTIDLAVHSLKDLPTELAPGLTLAAVIQRDDPSDLLLIRPDALDRSREIPLASGATVGASSLRRQAMLGLWRSDLVPVAMRGNVPTRIEKAARGDCDAIVLARAGLARLALEAAPLVAFDLNPSLWVCAPGQGAMAVEARQDDHRVLPHLAGLDDPATRACVSLERELLVSFGGGCHAPFGAWAVRTDQLCRVTVGAPGKGGRFSVRTFEATDLDSIRSQARAWIADGCQAREPADDHGGEAWISRPALPWF